MTMALDVDLTCPNCAAEFSGTVLASTNSFGGRTTDLHARAVGFQPLPLQMNICPTCGYSGFSDNFSSDHTISPEVKAQIAEHITPQVQEGAPLKSAGYEFTAMIAEWDGAPASRVGDLYLRAAWCCVDIGNRDDESLYREKAITYFERALQEEGQLDQPMRVVYSYLIGENYRRIGQVEQAHTWYDRTIEIVGDGEHDLAKLAREQKANPREMI